jgi:prevent-host-death family protein
MTLLDVHEAGPRLAELVNRVRAGEEVLIADAGKPPVRLVVVLPEPTARIFGEFEGRISIADDFAAPLTEEEMKDWEG